MAEDSDMKDRVDSLEADLRAMRASLEGVNVSMGRMAVATEMQATTNAATLAELRTQIIEMRSILYQPNGVLFQLDRIRTLGAWIKFVVTAVLSLIGNEVWQYFKNRGG